MCIVPIIFSCSRHNSPTLPVASNTPNYTQTNMALFTHTITPTYTASNTPNYTQTYMALFTHTITPTYTVSPTITATSTITNTVGPTFDSSALVSVPGGTFTQTDGTYSFSHTVSAFKMGKYQVTYDLWYTVHTWGVANGYAFQNAGVEGNSGTDGAAPTAAKYHPVTNVNWRDVIVWCNAYSQMSGFTPVYCSDAGFTMAIKSSTSGSYGSSVNTTAGSFDIPYVNWIANGFRLPTEGEYQYAASWKGTDSSNGAIEFPVGSGNYWTPYNYASGATGDTNNATATGLVAWYSANSGSTTHDVGGKTANALGIYDMSGNVYEWCWDWDGTYPSTASTNYIGPDSGSARVMRGESFVYYASLLQVGHRDNDSPYDVGSDRGFRFARSN